MIVRWPTWWLNVLISGNGWESRPAYAPTSSPYLLNLVYSSNGFFELGPLSGFLGFLSSLCVSATCLYHVSESQVSESRALRYVCL
jgi:hypothetical protein